ncbi:ATP-binding protein [uncultured Shewanella sp.]|uniref:sensor histidine kinase n=1 Tax=uncultured Shewanella sp. TaxID=173975 RepID=UPI00261A127D|nr:ATP-binding protein [uncultured Shewanella sp.]
MLLPSAAPISSSYSLDNNVMLEEVAGPLAKAKGASLSIKPSLELDHRMRHILHAMPSGIVILNANGVIEQANPVACELLRQNNLSAYQKDHGDTEPVKANAMSPLVGQLWREVIKTAFLPQNDDGYEVSLRSGRRVSIAIRPLTPEPGQLIVLTDLTETRRLQKNVSHLQRLSALGKMVATLAHQVRTPLTAAILYAENLSHHHITQSVRDKFQKKLLNRLFELEHQVSDMLLTVKGQSQQTKSGTTIGAVIEKVLENCTPIAHKYQCQLTVNNADSDSDSGSYIDSQGHIVVDEPALVSALNNVLMNSLEAGASNIALQAYKDDAYLVVEILDDGAGLIPSCKANTPFFTTKAQGTGLGLSVVRSVMAQHCGEFSIVNRSESHADSQGCRALLRFLTSTKQDDVQATADAAKHGGIK